VFKFLINSNFQGTIYKLSIFNEALTQQEVTSRYQIRLRNSLPVVWNITVTIKQNGEVGDHHIDPVYYLHPVPLADLDTIALPIFDLDDDAKSPNYIKDRTNCSTIVIMSLPKRGILYDSVTGTIISIGSTISFQSGYQIKYRPEFNAHSM
jgi:hypothetical protein